MILKIQFHSKIYFYGDLPNYTYQTFHWWNKSTLENTEGAIQRNWQHKEHKTKKNKTKTQYVFDTTIPNQTQIT